MNNPAKLAGAELIDGNADMTDCAPAWYPNIAITSCSHISMYSNSVAAIAAVF